MQGLEQANRLMNPNERDTLLEELRDSREKRIESDAKRAARPAVAVAEKPVRSVNDAVVWKPKDLAPRIKRDYSVAHLQPYVNMRTLIGHHLGLKGNLEQMLKDQDERAILLMI